MKQLAATLRHSRYLLALMAGLLLAAAFPKIGISGLAWVAPGLIVASALGKRGWESFRIGYVAGLGFYLGSLYWLLLIPYRWMGIPLGPAAGWLALSAYLAVYPATWVWILCRIEPRITGPNLGTANASNLPSWFHRAAWSFTGAATWVGLEMIVGRLFSGFPWCFLGGTQYRMTPLIQVAAVTGIYGVSFLVVWVALSLVIAARMMLRQPNARSVWMVDLILPLLVTAALFATGLRQLQGSPTSERQLRVTMLQPSIPQTLIWDTSRDDERFRELIQLSKQALTNQTDILIWPEAAVPKLLRYDQEVFDAITGLARSNKVWMIIGADDAERRAKPTKTKDADYFNSSFLISPEGKLIKRYRKRSLVIFGEYIPLERWISVFKFFTPIQGGFTPGDGPVPFEIPDLNLKTSVLICFEDVFPHHAREYPEPDTDFLVNITNNGWFGESAAQWQHAASALFRAVENGLPLIRCSNNGLTCWVDGQGRLREIFRDSRGTVYGPGFLIIDVPLLNHGQTRAPTFYQKFGDSFGWACVGLAVLGIALSFIRGARLAS